MVLYCFKCHQEVVFDAEHIGKNGRKIPLDPTTRRPHDCPERDKQFTAGESGAERVELQEKNDHGNESFPPPGAKKILELTPEGMELLKEANKEFVDHTQPTKGQSKVKIFFNQHNTDVLAIEYNEFLSTNNGKIKTQGAQFQMTEDGFAIALYYEETKQ